MSKNDPYHDNKKYHFAAKTTANGDVSALCFDPPRKINLRRELWTLTKSAVTCKKCLSILKNKYGE